jgi:hypothetical protein
MSTFVQIREYYIIVTGAGPGSILLYRARGPVSCAGNGTVRLPWFEFEVKHRGYVL